MPDEPFLTAGLEHHIGSFDLHIRFALTRPWTVLFGPSGAGKSTILRILAGLVDPDRGTISLHNRILVDTGQGLSIPPGQRQIGYMAQQPALFPHMTVQQNVAFGLSGQPKDEAARRVNETLELFRGASLSNRLPHELSGGEYQRVALARALAPEPALLLLDEPFSGLDGDLKASILNELTAWLAARRVPALYVSHDVAEAYQTGAEVLVIDKGRLEVQGPVEEVLAARRERLLQQLGVSLPKPAPAPAES